MRRVQLNALFACTCAVLLVGCQSAVAPVQPAPPPAPPQSLSFEIGGPYQIDVSGAYSWEAFAFGGSGAYQYQWIVANEAGHLISTASEREVSLFVADTDGNLVLTLTVTSGNERRVQSLSVRNCIAGC